MLKGAAVTRISSLKALKNLRIAVVVTLLFSLGVFVGAFYRMYLGPVHDLLTHSQWKVVVVGSCALMIVLAVALVALGRWIDLEFFKTFKKIFGKDLCRPDSSEWATLHGWVNGVLQKCAAKRNKAHLQKTLFNRRTEPSKRACITRSALFNSRCKTAQAVDAKLADAEDALSSAYAIAKEAGFELEKDSAEYEKFPHLDMVSA